MRTPSRSDRRRWAIGLVVGLVVGVAIIAGPLTLVLSLVAIILFVREPRRDAPVGGLLIGLGVGWTTLLGMAVARCDAGCASPDTRPWLVIAGASLVLGLVLSIRATRAANP